LQLEFNYEVAKNWHALLVEASLIERAFRSPIAGSRCSSSLRGLTSASADRARQRQRIAALAVRSSLRLRSIGQRRLDRGEGGWPNCDRDHRVKYGNGPWRPLSGAQLHSYQRNQLPTTPDQKGHDQKDKEARGEQLATGMRGRRKVKTIIRFASVANRRLRCSLSAQSTDVRERHVFLRNFPTLHDRDTKSPPAFTARNIIPPNVAANPPFVHSIHQGSLDVTSK
jgi:hypothetical protein